MKILLVDDHVLIRDALRGVLEELLDEADIVEVGNANSASRYIDENRDTDLVLLDLWLPDASGFDILSDLRAHHPATSVVVLSARDARADITRALELGALGFIPKSASREVMLGALELIFTGGVYVPPEILRHEKAVPSVAANSTSRCKRLASTFRLTERQSEVLDLLMHGMSNKVICRELDIAEPTVKNHVGAILKALGAKNRTEAVVEAAAQLTDACGTSGAIDDSTLPSR